MQDRTPTPGQEGRVFITPENGSAPFYAKVEMADNPTNPGTPLNKDSLLKDATAALFKLGADAVPDDVLSILSKAAILVGCNLELPNGSPVPQVKIETGSYVGTGTYGQSNPNTLTFEFEPKALFIQEENDNYQALMLPGKTISYPFYNNGEDIMFPRRSYNRVAFSGSSVSWYCDGADSLATVQLNQSNVNYYYLVLG